MKYMLILTCTLLLGSGCREKFQPAFSTGQEGKAMPGFTIQLADSVTFMNTRNVPAGTAAVLFYYSAVCPYCRAQMREMSERMKDLQHIRFYILTTASIGLISQIDEHYGFSKYKNVTVAADTGFFMPRFFRTGKVPFTAIYGPDKKMIRAYTGKISVSQIIAETKNLNRKAATVKK